MLLWLQIVFNKKRRVEKVRDVDFKTLAYLVDNTQFDRFIGTVDDISNGGFWNTTAFIKLILGHVFFIEKFGKPFAHSCISSPPVPITVLSVYESGMKI